MQVICFILEFDGRWKVYLTKRNFFYLRSINRVKVNLVTASIILDWIGKNSIYPSLMSI